jgi:tetratricopeptide (TPR) repeat protein
MQVKNTPKLFLALTILALVFLVQGLALAGDGKLPITTNSREALDNYLKGRDLFEKLRFNESREYFDKAVAADPKFALAYLNLSFVQPTNKGFFEMLDNALALKDKVSKGEKYWILAVQAGSNANTKLQREYFKKMVDLYPNDERAHNFLGNHYFGLQEYEQAIKQYDKALKINPKFSQPYNQLGYAHRFMGNYDKAEKAFKVYIKLIPDDPNPYDSYAELLMKMGRYDESIRNYQKALAISGNFPASHIGIANNYNFKGEHARAIEQLEKFFKTAKTDGQRRQAIFGMAISYADQRKLEKAMEMLEKQYAIAQQNNDIPAMANDLVAMGNILLQNNEYESATEKYREAVMMMVESGLADEVIQNTKRNYLYNIARVAAKEGKVKLAKARASEYKKQAVALENPFQIRLAHELDGIIALAEKNYKKAIKELEKSNLQDPCNIYRMAQAYQGKGQATKAQEYCKKAAEYNPLNNLNFACVRNQVENMLADL